ncbi:MAG: DUF58 domain-containing protein [Candidatus Dormibacteria bacterium]
MLIASAVIARRKRELRAVRSHLAARAREGQVLDVDITLTSKRRMGMFIVEEKLSPLLGAPVRVSVERVTPKEDWSHRYSLRPKLRGVYQVGPLAATWTDPLGLAQAEQVLLPPAEIIVHPTAEMVFDRPLTRELQDPPIRPPKTKPWPEGFEFYGMRDYIAGDDLRRVVWKAVARTGRMLVRESEQGITDRVNIVLDTDRSWHRPTVPSDTFEAAVRVAASVGTRHVKDGFSVSLDCNGATLAENLRGPRARLLLLDELARVGLGREPLHVAIDRVLQRNARRAHTVIITPHLDTKAAARVGLLTAAGASILVAVVVWEDSDPMCLHRATEIGAQVVQVRPGAPLAGIFASSLGAGIR